MHTAWLKDKTENQWDWKAYLGVLAAVVGGAGVDYLFKTNFVGYFWIGIFVGFIATMVLRLLEGKDITKGPL